MRSRSSSDFDAVAARFAGWRAGRTSRAIPRELWAAAARLVGRYGVSDVCARLGLNASRFKEMREALGTTAESGDVGPVATSRSPATGGAAGGGFLELPALRVSPVGRATVAPESVGGADGDCTLVLDGGSGIRLTIALRQSDPEMVHAVCQLVLNGVVDRSDRSRR